MEYDDVVVVIFIYHMGFAISSNERARSARGGYALQNPGHCVVDDEEDGIG